MCVFCFMWCRYHSDVRSVGDSGRERALICWAEMEQGCHIMEMTNLYLDMCWWTQLLFVGYFVRNPPCMIFKTKPNMQSASIRLMINETFSHEMPDCQL